jgi:aminopeptidase-like protein
MLMLDGDKSVFDISEELGMDFYDVLDYINKFSKNNLIDRN